MIIPMVCMNCGYHLADKWRWYQSYVTRRRQELGLKNEPFYIDGNSKPDTPEREACDKLGVTRYCCRKVFLTHRDLIDKI